MRSRNQYSISGNCRTHSSDCIPTVVFCWNFTRNLILAILGKKSTSYYIWLKLDPSCMWVPYQTIVTIQLSTGGIYSPYIHSVQSQYASVPSFSLCVHYISVWWVVLLWVCSTSNKANYISLCRMLLKCLQLTPWLLYAQTWFKYSNNIVSTVW